MPGGGETCSPIARPLGISHLPGRSFAGLFGLLVEKLLVKPKDQIRLLQPELLGSFFQAVSQFPEGEGTEQICEQHPEKSVLVHFVNPPFWWSSSVPKKHYK